MANQGQRLEQIAAEMAAALPASAALADGNSKVIPGGTTRGRFWWPFPIYMREGSGARITDVDGRSYLDCNLGFGPLILGHNHPVVVEALEQQLARGVDFGPPNESEAPLAELIVANVPGAEKMVFASSGTESTLGALRIARAATGRQKVAKFEGGWHGIQDFLFHSYSSFGGTPEHAETIPDTSGISKSVEESVVVLPYNDALAFDRIRAEASDLACVIVEPMQGGGGAINIDSQFLSELRALCTELGVLLIADEVITGFRVGPTGGCGHFGVEADLTTLGKVIGGGMSVGAICGPSRYMDLTIPTPTHKAASIGGTHTANPMSMAAGLAQMNVLLSDAGASYAGLNRLGDQFRADLTRMLADLDVNGFVTGMGSIWGIHFTSSEPHNLRDQAANNVTASRLLAAYLLLEGVLVSSPMHLAFLSTEHTAADVDFLLQAHRSALQRIKSEGWL